MQKARHFRGTHSYCVDCLPKVPNGCATDTTWCPLPTATPAMLAYLPNALVGLISRRAGAAAGGDPSCTFAFRARSLTSNSSSIVRANAWLNSRFAIHSLYTWLQKARAAGVRHSLVFAHLPDIKRVLGWWASPCATGADRTARCASRLPSHRQKSIVNARLL